MRNNRCPKCSSEHIMADVEVRDWGPNGSHPLRVHITEPEPDKHGFIWKQGSSAGAVRAWICAACGYTELYTDNLGELYDSYRKGHPGPPYGP
ncbi:hypothetical protein N5079_18185 [Planotetraspora sp. A-T 1434]|uniref:hypothetical protein n=1 Tax=Planotetraspora sp. A-T 1434 TaxID=2979219 RepID=UPI0021C1AE7E|nr:hypothetical protein [Planotetraspora sp. A-T 1434]MCT9932134.1 hypothetical protein [Planotetraspora sp. A-T 1434]